MSSGPDREPGTRALPPEDDWFAAPEPRGGDWFSPSSEQPAAPAELTWDDEARDEPPAPVGPTGLGQRQLTVVVAALGIVAVVVVAILVVRAFGGSDETNATPTTSVPAASTPAETLPASTTPETTTGATTTVPATTTPETTTGATTTEPATTTPVATVDSVPAEQTLRPGMSGSSVLALQQALAQLGYDPGAADGSYGPGTTEAVTAFQGDNDLKQDGIAGPATLEAVNAALASG